MFSIEFEIIIVIILSAITCSIPGAFLVMRKNYYAADTTNRSAMLGIAVALIFSSYLSSPLVIILGSLTAGLAMILIKKIKDFTSFRAKGLSIIVSSAFLCFGILIASNFSFTNATNFDLSIIYLGETAFTYFNRLRVFGVDIGSYALYAISLVLIINIIIITVFYKEFKIDGVDKNYAASIQMKESTIDYLLLIMTSLSVSVSFQTAGIFMTSAFILGPAATALFYTKRLSTLAFVSVFISSIACLAGFGIAWPNEVSISGTIVSFLGILFIASVLFSPEEGLLKKHFDNLTTQKRLEEYIIMDILNSEIIDCREKNVNEAISSSLKWKLMKVSYIMNKLKAENKIEIVQNKVQLTEEGKSILNKFLSAQHCFH
ncbi:MAG: metal ABC transporter permease [Mucispirillum sp.]|nr:metal ABC transporter permease [Mucispirillum sp.]